MSIAHKRSVDRVTTGQAKTQQRPHNIPSGHARPKRQLQCILGISITALRSQLGDAICPLVRVLEGEAGMVNPGGTAYYTPEQILALRKKELARREVRAEMFRHRTNGWMNLAVGLVTVGIFSPGIALLLGLEKTTWTWLDVGCVMVICLVVSLGLVKTSHFSIEKGLVP